MSLTKVKQDDLKNTIQKMVFAKSSIDINKISSAFNVTRQTVYSYIKKLINEKKIEKNDEGYVNIRVSSQIFSLDFSEERDEDKVYNKYILPNLPSGLKPNVQRIIRFGVTEMFNNAVDHSESDISVIFIIDYGFAVAIIVKDYGVGIFNKVQQALNLDSPRESILELAKGKFTSDPENHTGQGIFFYIKDIR